MGSYLLNTLPPGRWYAVVDGPRGMQKQRMRYTDALIDPVYGTAQIAGSPHPLTTHDLWRPAIVVRRSTRHTPDRHVEPLLSILAQEAGTRSSRYPQGAGWIQLQRMRLSSVVRSEAVWSEPLPLESARRYAGN
jgi:hypothetical protein